MLIIIVIILILMTMIIIRRRRMTIIAMISTMKVFFAVAGIGLSRPRTGHGNGELPAVC